MPHTSDWESERNCPDTKSAESDSESLIHKPFSAGLILAGGRSSRFGQDKALFRFRGIPLISYSIKTLAPVCNKLFISTNNPEAYTGFGLSLITDQHPGMGPLAGLQAGLSQISRGWMAVISCDTPFVPVSLYSYLGDFTGDHQVVLPVHHGYTEALCGLYEKSVQPLLEQAISRQNLKILDAVAPARNARVDIAKQPFYRQGMFHNINHMGDLPQI